MCDDWTVIDCLDYIRLNNIPYNEPFESADVDLDEVQGLVAAHLAQCSASS